MNAVKLAVGIGVALALSWVGTYAVIIARWCRDYDDSLFYE